MRISPEGLVSFTISAQLEIGTEHLRSSFPLRSYLFQSIGAECFSFVDCSRCKYNIAIITVFVFNSCSPSLGGGMVGGGSVVGGSVGA